MAIGLDFLSKTKMGAANGAQQAGKMQDVMSAQGAQQSNNTNSVFASSDQNGAQKQDKTALSDMNSSDLLKYVYNNKGGDNNEIKLPAHIKYDDQDIPINGKSFDEAVDVIAQQTGDSKSKIESQLKKDYGTVKGGSLNMQA